MKRRRLLITGVLLLLGAIVNVAVAWGCVLFATFERRDPYQADRQRLVAESSTGYWEFWSIARRGACRFVEVHTVLTPDEISVDALFEIMEVAPVATPHWSQMHDKNYSPPAEFDMFAEDVSGWPLLCIHYRLNLKSSGLVHYAHSVIGGVPVKQIHGDNKPQQITGMGAIRSSYLYARTLPLRPIWPGFAINTIFYAAMLWVVCFVPGMVRRRIRRRRGLCPACAYPIGTSEVCTECGNPMKVRTGMALPPPRTDEVMT